MNCGIVFRRVDLDPAVEIPAFATQVGDTSMSTTLERDGVRVATGLGESRRVSAARKNPVRLVANGTTGRAEMELPNYADLEMMPTDRDRRLAQAENKDLFSRQRDIDYLDIPSFLRNQAD